MSNALTTLVGEEWEDEDKWSGIFAAPNGSVYGIPATVYQVLKFNPVDNFETHIGPEFSDGFGYNWLRGVITNSGVIYCTPYKANRGILKIDTNTDTFTKLELDNSLLPEQVLVVLRRFDMSELWLSCALALDGCIYFMPCRARRIMKLDPNNNNAMSSVGDDLGGGYDKYCGTVVGIDGCVYGIPFKSNRIVKFNPIHDTTSYVGEPADEAFNCSPRDGAVARDGCIYAVTKDGRVLKIDPINNAHCFIENSIESEHRGMGWGDAILGIDGCIYWPPYHARRILKYDPYKISLELVGDTFEIGGWKWGSGALASDGIIYCVQSDAERILAIDPIGEFLATTKANMQDHPEQFGSLFQTIEADEDSTQHVSLTNFDLAVVKFGHDKVFEVLEKAMKPMNDYCKESNLCPFIIAASCKESTVCAIYHLLRRDLSWINIWISSLEGNTPKKKKIRIK